MRTFKVKLVGYGGEVTIGRITREFHDYWKAKGDDECDVKYHIATVDMGNNEDDEDFDPESPMMRESGNCPWHEVDDIEHQSGVYADNGYVVVELDEDGEEIPDTEQTHEFNAVYGREAYSYTEQYLMESKQLVEAFPVLTFHTCEKGYFGDIIIETEGEDFDPELFEVSTLETDVCELVEAFRYNGKDVGYDMDWYDTRSKSDDYSLGLMVDRWRDKTIEWPE